MNWAARYRLADGVLAQATLAEAVLLDARGGRYFSANPVATVLLRELLAGADARAMATRIQQEFEQEEATICADVQDCLADWLARGLIVECSPAGHS